MLSDFPSSNDVASVVVRSRSTSGQHLLDPLLCVCLVSKLILLQPVREILDIRCRLGLVSISSHSYRTYHVPGIRELLRFICGLASHVALVLDEKKLADCVGDMLVDLAHPILHAVGRFLVRHITDCDDVVCFRLSTHTGILN